MVSAAIPVTAATPPSQIHSGSICSLVTVTPNSSNRMLILTMVEPAKNTSGMAATNRDRYSSFSRKRTAISLGS